MNFKSDPMGQQEHYFNMEWVTESISPVTNFKLQYKEEDTYYSINAIRDDTDDWTEVQVVPQSNGDHYYAGRYTIDKLSPAKNYVARVASKNDYGYSKFSQAFRFGTKGAGNYKSRLFLVMHLWFFLAVLSVSFIFWTFGTVCKQRVKGPFLKHISPPLELNWMNSPKSRLGYSCLLSKITHRENVWFYPQWIKLFVTEPWLLLWADYANDLYYER